MLCIQPFQLGIQFLKTRGSGMLCIHAMIRWYVHSLLAQYLSGRMYSLIVETQRFLCYWVQLTSKQLKCSSPTHSRPCRFQRTPGRVTSTLDQFRHDETQDWTVNSPKHMEMGILLSWDGSEGNQRHRGSPLEVWSLSRACNHLRCDRSLTISWTLSMRLWFDHFLVGHVRDTHAQFLTRINLRPETTIKLLTELSSCPISIHIKDTATEKIASTFVRTSDRSSRKPNFNFILHNSLILRWIYPQSPDSFLKKSSDNSF